MQIPNWTPYEFLNASTLTSGFGAVSGSFAQLLSGVARPGLIAPDSITLTPVGLAVTVAAPLPFQTLFGSGTLAAASGVTTGQVTNSYAVNFSGLVPASGSVTAYLLVSGISIQEGAYQVVGPPPGHPDYNPLFVPSTAYNTLVDSVTFVVSTTAANNTSTFEIARTSLAAGATGVTLTTLNQQRAFLDLTKTSIIQTNGVVSLVGQPIKNRTYQFTASGSIALPAASGYNGVEMNITNISAAPIQVSVNGSDLIYGVNCNIAGASSVTVVPYGSVSLLNEIGTWMVTAISLAGAAGPVYVLTASGTVTLSGAFNSNRAYQFSATGTFNLPSAVLNSGIVLTVSQTSTGSIGVFTSGGDPLYGVSSIASGTSTTITGYGSIDFLSEGNAWVAKSVSQSLAASPVFGLTYAGLFTSGFTVQAGFMYDVDTTAGSFSGTYSGTLNVADTFGINRVGVNLFTLNWATGGGTAGSKYLGDPNSTPWYPEGIQFFRWSGTNRGFG